MKSEEKNDLKWMEMFKTIVRGDEFKHVVTVLAWLTGQTSLVGLIFWLLMKQLG